MTEAVTNSFTSESLLGNPAKFNGYALQTYLLENIDLIGYLAAFYLVVVGKGPGILCWLTSTNKRKVDTRSPLEVYAKLNTVYKLSFIFHLLSAGVYLVCAVFLVPSVLSAIRKTSFYGAMCIWEDKQLYLGEMGYWSAVMIFAKTVDLFDTCLLLLRDHIIGVDNALSIYPVRTITPSHWWYRVLMALYFWHTYSIGISTFTTLASINATAHAALNVIYAVEDMYYSKDATKRVTAGSTEKSTATPAWMRAAHTACGFIFMSECLLSSAVAIYSSVMNFGAESGCMVTQANVRMCVLLLLSTALQLVREMQVSEERKIMEAAAAALNKKISNGVTEKKKN